MATAFTTDDDLIQRRKNIMELGVKDFSDQHLEAARQITRDLKFWYETECVSRGRDPRYIAYDQTKLLNADEEIKPSAVLLALSLAYDLLAKDTPADTDGFQAQRDHYRKEFDREWGMAKLAGFTYDWLSSGALDATDKPETQYRTLKRQ